jgi:hypothetical protein
MYDFVCWPGLEQYIDFATNGFLEAGIYTLTGSAGGGYRYVTDARFSVNFVVTTPLSIICPADLTDVPTDPGRCYATGVSLGTPTICDNCNAASVTNDAPAQFSNGPTTVIWTVTDTNGNTAQCTQSVTVADYENPTITCPANITINATSPAGTAVSFAPTASDNCSVANVSCSPASGSTFAIGTTTVTCQAIDGSANTNTCTFTVTVERAAIDPDQYIIVCYNGGDTKRIKYRDFVKDNGRHYTLGPCPMWTMVCDKGHDVKFIKTANLANWLAGHPQGAVGNCTGAKPDDERMICWKSYTIEVKVKELYRYPGYTLAPCL